MSNIDKQAVQAVADLKGGYTLGHADVAILNELARIALASLEAGPVAWAHRLINKRNGVVHPWVYGSAETSPSEGDIFNIEVMPLYTAPPAPVSVPDEEQCKPHPVMAVKGELGFLDNFDRIISERDEDIDIGQLGSGNCEALMLAALDAFRAAMLQGAEHVMMAYKLPDDFDFDRFNDVVWLEAVASNPHMHSLTTSTIAMVALELNKRLEAGNSPVIPDGLRLALSNAGIAAPESDEMLAATCEKYIQALVTWVKDRKPFRSAVIPDGWVACSERMPEVGVKVLCFPVNDEPIHATYNGQVWLQDISWSTSDEPIDNVISCNVFHWMPLPAAPQQE
ncbi:TPA: DUF551 domain-containing protein [Enterobacter hormaechei subsp. steigerwaltii]|nr:DUF551 domain-containing protein [Enterobacter hormaechei subsp. steigerwaltii]